MKKASVILSHMSGGGGGGSANHGQLTTSSPLLPFNNRRTLPLKREDTERWGIVYYLLYSQMFDGGIVGNFVMAGSPFLAGVFIA